MKGDLEHMKKVKKWPVHEAPNQIPVQIENRNASDNLVKL